MIFNHQNIFFHNFELLTPNNRTLRMLQSLSIQNYALIDKLDIEFDKGFTIITGETGAGKSILLGALSLLVGQRADTSVLLDKTKKCAVEGIFEISNYQLNDFFRNNQIEYHGQTIIRREIHENGRSRAFVNDTPVNLNILKELGDQLIDIHSQHQNLYLNNYQFQLKVIDTLAKNTSIIQTYRESYKKHGMLQLRYSELLERSRTEKEELDYLQHQFEELDLAKLKNDEQTELENEIKILSHAEEIKTYLNLVSSLFLSDQNGILIRLKEASVSLSKIKSNYQKASTIQQRIDTTFVELKDIANETESMAESIELDPGRLETVKNRLDLIYSLCQKHKVQSSDELIKVKNLLEEKIKSIISCDDELRELKKEFEAEYEKMNGLAMQLSQSRKAVIPSTEESITELLHQLGMPNGYFSVRIEQTEHFNQNGIDKMTFLFSANKNIEQQDLSKIASGGEISRVMLALKSVVSASLAMPTVIFDEIDSGVSGELAEKMANIMKQMAGEMQVISITHLPQVAAKGRHHFLVYKIENQAVPNSCIKLLNSDDRVIEIAKMLSGEELTEAAISNAKVLLNL
jgi:DNA repair protein RecN (Recombination protein N)